MLEAQRFPYIESDESLGAASILPFVPLRLQAVMNRTPLTDASDPHTTCSDVRDSQESVRFPFTNRRLLLLTLLFAAVLGWTVSMPVMLSWAYHRWEVGKQFDQSVLQTSSFTLRITAFRERGAIFAASGGYYRYEVKTESDYWWRKIALFRLPTPDPVPNGQFQLVTDSFAYFHHGHIFGVTTDGGTTWSIKGGDNGPIFSGHTFPYADIETVTIDQDGTGVMCLSDYDPLKLTALPSHNLSTIDFGETWKSELW
jgi:hypothetical protein